MFVGPSLVGSLGRSWKNIRESNFFLLQQKGQQQQANNVRKRRHVPEYRIITRSFPHYKVAHNDDLNIMQDAFDILHNSVLPEVEGKKTSKKILKQLKIWCEMEQNMSLPFDEDGYASDTSVTPEEGNSSNEMEEQNGEEYASKRGKNEISSSSSSRKSGELDEREALVQTPLREFTDSDFGGESSSIELANNPEPGSSGHIPQAEGLLALGNYVTESMQSFFEGPSMDTINSAKNNPNTTHNKHATPKTVSIMDIPLQFIDLLTYPDVDPTASKKASFAVLREISFVKQRRKTLLMLTLFLFFIRICSWDLFLLLVFGANCGMLFLMKNSGKVNVTMAKRAVRQRIGWAKQWAGSFLRKRGNSTNVTSNAPTHNNPSTPTNNKTAGTAGSKSPNTTNSSMSKSLTQDTIQSGSLSDTTHGGSVASKLTTRRAGFFRKHSHHIVHTGSLKTTHIPSAASETSSLMSTQNGSKVSLASSLTLAPTNGSAASNQPTLTNSTSSLAENSTSPSTTSKRRFFKSRHMNSNNNNSISNPNTVAPSSQAILTLSNNSSTTIGDGSLDLTDLLPTISASFPESANAQNEDPSASITIPQAVKSSSDTAPAGNTQVLESDFHDNEAKSADEFKLRKGVSSSTSSWGTGHRKNLSTSNASISS